MEQNITLASIDSYKKEASRLNHLSSSYCKDEVKEDKQTFKGSAKHKGDDVDRDQKLKMAKIEDVIKTNNWILRNCKVSPTQRNYGILKMILKIHVSTAELREMQKRRC